MKQHERAQPGCRYGKLTVIGVEIGPKPYPKANRKLICRCDCGKFTGAQSSGLLSGKHASCGCGKAEANIRTKTTHGMSESRTWLSWKQMRARCNNKNATDWDIYGGDGITVCDEWNRSFEAFHKDMGDRPAKTSLDRIDGSKGYFKDNCRWATDDEQARNKRNNVLVEINGESKCVGEWSAIFGAPITRAYGRLKRGMDPLEAFTAPSLRKRKS